MILPMLHRPVNRLSSGIARLLVPSLFAADHAALAEAVAEGVAAGATRFHVDVMDGRFVPALGLSIRALDSLAHRYPAVAFDVHLMTEAPEQLAEQAAVAGAASIAFHLEATRYPHGLLDRLRALGVVPGLAVNPATPAEDLAELAAECDLVVVMLVDPGRGGQAPHPAMLRKLAALRARHPSLLLVADGGVDGAHLAGVVAAGADHIVCGGALFGAAEGAAAAYARLAGALAAS